MVAGNDVMQHLTGQVPQEQLILVQPSESNYVSIDVDEVHVESYRYDAHPSNNYFITVGGCCIYHPGDYGVRYEYPYNFAQNNKVNLAFCACRCSPIDPNSMLSEVLTTYPNAEYLVGIHFGDEARCYHVPTSESSIMHRGDTIVVSSQGITDISHTHSRTILYGNLPNPFNRYTTISYQLPCDQNVTLVIYDVTGKLIRILSDNFETNGLHNIRWDGQNSDGIESPPGIYFSVLNGGSSSQTHKMLKIK